MSSLIVYFFLMFNRWKIIWPTQGIRNKKVYHPQKGPLSLCRHWLYRDSCRLVPMSKCADGEGRWRDYLRYQRWSFPSFQLFPINILLCSSSSRWNTLSHPKKASCCCWNYNNHCNSIKWQSVSNCLVILRRGTEAIGLTAKSSSIIELIREKLVPLSLAGKVRYVYIWV